MGKEYELEEGYVLDMNGDEQHEDECVTLNDGNICHEDEANYCESNGEYYHCDDDSIMWCETNECYYLESEMVYGNLYQGGEGWFHQDNYEYSEYSDRYFQCSDTADNCGFRWSDNRDDWIPEDVYDDESYEEWDATDTTKDTMITKT